jgi:hypothetical protein
MHTHVSAAPPKALVRRMVQSRRFDAPVGPHGHGPATFQVAFERMEAITGEMEQRVSKVLQRVELGQAKEIAEKFLFPSQKHRLKSVPPC